MATTPAIASTSEISIDERKRTGTSFWEWASFTIVHGFLGAVLYCVGLRGVYALTRFFGTVEWAINYKRRKRFARALRQVMGREPTSLERRRATKEYFIQNRCDKVFYLIFDRIPRERAMKMLTIQNRNVWDDAAKRGHGVYVALSHHGNHHIMGLLMPLLGYKGAGVRDGREGGLRRFVQQRFDQLYPEFGRARFLHSDSYPRDIYRLFQEGYFLGSAMDVSRVRGPNQRVEEVRIFGEKQPFVSGPMRIAIRCKAPILQAFILPDGVFSYRLDVVGMLIDPEKVEDEDAVVSEAMRVYAENVERYVRAAPWLMTRI